MLNILRNGIVYRPEGGDPCVILPHRTGGAPSRIDIDPSVSEDLELASGDVLIAEVETCATEDATPELSDEQFDEPDENRVTHRRHWALDEAAGRIRTLQIVNGLALEEARERPRARGRSKHDRAAPTRHIRLAEGSSSETADLLDTLAPLGLGMCGVVAGPHGSGVTTTLRAVASGVIALGSEAQLIVLLVEARGEEVTAWRRKFPEADVVACPTSELGAAPHEILLVADLVRECAMRQSELGHHVVVLVDSLAALWAAMLGHEHADAQFEADHALARRRIVDWLGAAGWFGGDSFLSSGLGGSVTIIGGAWSAPVDADAEEERELHPQLRLLEHILPLCDWQVYLDGKLAARRLFPAIDVGRTMSRGEEALFDERELELHRASRTHLLDTGAAPSGKEILWVLSDL